MTLQEKADKLLSVREDLYETHFHEADRIWLIDAMIDFSELTKQQIKITENTSDGYHTFKELYEFRKVYNAALFNEWHKQSKYWVHKSWRHHDGELCFGGGWFIVVAVLPGGQISNHYEAKDWDLFQVKEVQKAIFEFDGHTGQDVIERIKEICK